MTGLILLDKPEGMTSFAACSVIRGITGEKHVGHTGTLDPMATGVLPILVGRATALSQYLIEADKSYRATVRLGIKTDTMDITGNVLNRCDEIPCEERVRETVSKFLGTQTQTPPMYSAIKVEGRRLYDLARKGEEAQIPQREITVKDIKIIEFIRRDEFIIDVTCSKGTYIRSLSDDIGKALGCGATLTALRRTVTAGFPIENCVTLDDIRKNGAEGYIKSPAEALPHLQRAYVSEKQAVRFTNGGALDLQRISDFSGCDGEKVCVMFGERMLGIACVMGEPLQLAPKSVIDKI